MYIIPEVKAPNHVDISTPRRLSSAIETVVTLATAALLNNTTPLAGAPEVAVEKS